MAIDLLAETACKSKNKILYPTQEAGALPFSASKMYAGASSFGMSGVNAHGLFTSLKVLTHKSPEVDWQRERHWMAPKPHQMHSNFQYSGQAGKCR